MLSIITLSQLVSILLALIVFLFPFSVLSVREPSEPNGIKYVINGNVQESPPAIYYGGGTQYVYTNQNGDEVIKSLGVVKQEAILNIKVISNFKADRMKNITMHFDFLPPLSVHFKERIRLRHILHNITTGCNKEHDV